MPTTHEGLVAMSPDEILTSRAPVLTGRQCEHGVARGRECGRCVALEDDARKRQASTLYAPHEPDGWFPLREPCPDCKCTVGRLRLVSGQHTVRCADCDRFAFNAPKAALGLPNEAPKAVRITSKFDGSCKGCGADIEKGDAVFWIPKTKGVTCARCHQKQSEAVK